MKPKILRVKQTNNSLQKQLLYKCIINVNRMYNNLRYMKEEKDNKSDILSKLKKSTFKYSRKLQKLEISKKDNSKGLNSFQKEIEKNQGWSLYLHKQIRSKEHFRDRQIQFLKGIRKELIQVTHFLKNPSQQFMQKSEFQIQERIQTKNKCLFIEPVGVLVNETYDFDAKKKDLKNLILRSHAMQFLAEMKNYYDIYIFTQKNSRQAHKIARKIDQHGQFFIDIISKQNCFTTRKQKTIKDLRLITNKKIRNCVMLDTRVYSFGFNVLNGIPIIPFDKQQNNDNQLKSLVPLLRRLSIAKDVRNLLQQELNLLDIAEEAWESESKKK